jgi:hypothetical protein
VSCDLCAGPGSGSWLVFDARRLRRRPTVGRYIIELRVCGFCLGLMRDRATPTGVPYTTQVPGRAWPWPARIRTVS